MNPRGKLLLAAAGLSMLLVGCGMRTTNQMYCMPKRPESFYSLQNSIDQVMDGMQYSAPLTGEHQQTVQMEDLDGDGTAECLLFARGSGEKPLNIFIFRQEGDIFQLDQTLSCNGSAFEQISYVQLDGRDGMELIVGCQVSEQVPRAVTVFSYAQGESEQLMSTSYTKLISCDLNEDGLQELMILHPGATETDRGQAELYGFHNGRIERSAEISMSRPIDQLKRIVNGKLEDGVPAVYIAQAVDDKTLTTDIFTLCDEKFTNLSAGSNSGNNVRTERKYYAYADDIDGDGVLELPQLLNPASQFQEKSLEHQWVIRWYSLDSQGSKITKAYTFHNFRDGWFIRLEDSVAPRTMVTMEKSNPDEIAYRLGTWDTIRHEEKTYLTVYELTGQEREELAAKDNRFVLYRGDSVTYAARLEAVCAEYGISQDSLVSAFGLLNKEWNTGETRR